MSTKRPLKERWEEWVLANYEGKVIKDPPKGWDPKTEMYYLMGEKQYGPIHHNDIPRDLWNEMAGRD